MVFSVDISGVYTPPAPENRIIAYLKVIYDGVEYDWMTFVPPEEDLVPYVQSQADRIKKEIDLKELEWLNLDPKTKSYPDPFNEGQTILVPIEKNEIVAADVPDYYAKRRMEYPPISEQLDSFWKGVGSAEFVEMQQKIIAVKQKYPKVQVESELEKAKNERLQYITVMRNNAMLTLSTEWNNDIWDADEGTSTRIANVLTMIQQASMAGIPTPPSIAWRTFDNQDRQLTVAEMVQLGAAIFLAQQAVWTKQATLKNQITNATTIDEVNGISW